MWRVLASRLDGKYSFGFIKDADGKARKELGADEGEGVKVVTWSADGQKEVYSGELMTGSRFRSSTIVADLLVDRWRAQI